MGVFDDEKNLLHETENVLARHGKTLGDIAWIGCEDFTIPVEEFVALADREYDSGYGGQEVAEDLIICGADWWLERHEYDGAEWWEYKTIPVRPQEEKSVHTLFADLGWKKLSEFVK